MPGRCVSATLESAGKGTTKRTQRSWFPFLLILLPPLIAEPLATHGPDMLGALAMLIRFPVEKRKYVPSDRRMSAGSWEFPQTPEHGPGVAKAAVKTASERSGNNELNRPMIQLPAKRVWAGASARIENAQRELELGAPTFLREDDDLERKPAICREHAESDVGTGCLFREQYISKVNIGVLRIVESAGKVTRSNQSGTSRPPRKV